MTGTIAQLSVSDGGVPKLPVPRARVDATGMEGDRQRDLVHHGGPDRALCLYSLDVIEALRAEGHPIDAGSAGENVTVSDVEWSAVIPGTRMRLGPDVAIEITGYATPCAHNKPWFVDGNFLRMSQSRHPGWSRVYARVLTGGTLEPGHSVEVI